MPSRQGIATTTHCLLGMGLARLPVVPYLACCGHAALLRKLMLPPGPHPIQRGLAPLWLALVARGQENTVEFTPRVPLQGRLAEVVSPVAQARLILRGETWAGAMQGLRVNAAPPHHATVCLRCRAPVCLVRQRRCQIMKCGVRMVGPRATRSLHRETSRKLA